ncbi:MAG TPA: asparagine synthase (glutamine-hydrolyzing) [Thermoanaerobaculia bacterium]|nr:asparagine synthase (glutamine-hydrolyzing) [Thermoanaerobaculia bacterium]
MCGIYGMVSPSGAALRFPAVLDFMGEALRHRGPDGRAVLRGDSAAIGTERLRIIDLHERADQPFCDPQQQIWLECNGEIYNAPEIRAKYADYPFRSHSDVESIIPLYLDKGMEAIPMLDGMFGLAIRDNRTGALILARDRAGEKPLFYARPGREVVFASELQSVLEHPSVSRDLDRIAIDEYLRLGYVPEPRTMFTAVRRVPAGAYIRFDGSEEIVRYWRPETFETATWRTADAIAELQRLVERAVTKQVMADVPVGVFVSGGLDSSILAALASQTIGVDKVHTFSARFAEQSYDESGDAARVAVRMRTKYVPVRTDEETLLEALRAVTQTVAEPIADPAILPTFLLAREARKYVKVILSGEGADELFGGYPTYIGHKLAPLYHAIPSPLRRAIRAGVAHLPTSSKKVTLEFLLKKFVSDAELPWIERHLSWFGTGLSTDVYAEAPVELPDLPRAPEGRDALSGAMLVDYRSYLRDNLLVKVDRATMLSSVEARAPYLDRDLTRFALSLPPELRVRRATTKWLLKKAAEKWLPKDVIYRRKRGLSVPIAAWINRGLRGEVDRLLAPEKLRARGFINESYATRLLAEHRSGRANHARPLWALLMLQYWLDRWAA